MCCREPAERPQVLTRSETSCHPLIKEMAADPTWNVCRNVPRPCQQTIACATSTSHGRRCTYTLTHALQVGEVRPLTGEWEPLEPEETVAMGAVGRLVSRSFTRLPSPGMWKGDVNTRLPDQTNAALEHA